MELGTIVYLKNLETLYRYIVYRKDKNIYLLEKVKTPQSSIEQYINFSVSEYVENVILDKSEIEKEINEKLAYYNNKIIEAEALTTNTRYIDYDIKKVEEQILNIENKEDKTENQIKSIQQLKKCLKRYEKAKLKLFKETEAEKERIKTRYQKKIINLNAALSVLKEV